MSQPKDAQLGYLPTRQEWVLLPLGQGSDPLGVAGEQDSGLGDTL